MNEDSFRLEGSVLIGTASTESHAYKIIENQRNKQYWCSFFVVPTYVFIEESNQ